MKDSDDAAVSHLPAMVFTPGPRQGYNVSGNYTRTSASGIISNIRSNARTIHDDLNSSSSEDVLSYDREALVVDGRTPSRQRSAYLEESSAAEKSAH
jgi:hypothetical protein